MLARILAIIKNLDWWLALAVFVLTSIGLAELYSIDSGTGGKLFERQLIVALGGILAVLIFVFIDYYFFYSYSQYVYIFGVIMLLLVLFFGKEVNYTKGWLVVFGVTIQSVEIAKICLIVVLAKYFSKALIKVNTVKVLVQSGLFLTAYVLLVLLQPDTGSACVLIGIWVMLIIFAGLPKKYIFFSLLIITVFSYLSWNYYLVGYQKDRIMNVVHSAKGSLTGDYNVNQAIIAVGSGKLVGRGLGFGSQSQLRFLPEAKTDFMFAVISEELGLIGVVTVLLCFLIIFFRILINLANVKNNFGIYFMLGTLGLIFIQMFTNIGMNMGLLPVVGITLPFLSYGGSSLAANLFLMGIVQSIIVRSKIKNY